MKETINNIKEALLNKQWNQAEVHIRELYEKVRNRLIVIVLLGSTVASGVVTFVKDKISALLG